MRKATRKLQEMRLADNYIASAATLAGEKRSQARLRGSKSLHQRAGYGHPRLVSVRGQGEGLGGDPPKLERGVSFFVSMDYAPGHIPTCLSRQSPRSDSDGPPQAVAGEAPTIADGASRGVTRSSEEEK